MLWVRSINILGKMVQDCFKRSKFNLKKKIHTHTHIYIKADSNRNIKKLSISYETYSKYLTH